VRLPIVRIDSEPPSFISRTAWAASWLTRRVFCHASGSAKVLEKTTFDVPASESVFGSPSLANPNMSR
jgi:hypothetical protein